MRLTLVAGLCVVTLEVSAAPPIELPATVKATPTTDRANTSGHPRTLSENTELGSVDETRLGEAGACCDTLTGCEVLPESQCLGTFLGIGTDCNPDCCPQALTGGDSCGLAQVHDLIVPFDGFGEPIPGGVSVTISGDSTPATAGDCPGLGSDLGWWEAFSIDAEAKVTIDLCCDDDPPTSGYVLLYENCIGGECSWPTAADNFGSGQPVCDAGDANVWAVWDALLPGTYYYPIYADLTADPGNLGDYQMHILAEGLPNQACCFGGTCDDTLNRNECERQGGFPLDGVPECFLADCTTGACCFDPADCTQVPGPSDCDSLGGDFIGGARCSDNPCPVCAIGQTENCQRDTGSFIVLIDRAITDGEGNYVRWADDFTATNTGRLDQLCWWPAFLAPTSECSAPGELPPDNWILRLYEDDNGLPGTEITTPGGIPITVDVKVPLGALSRVWLYSGSLGGLGPVLLGGGCYWIEITGAGNGSGGCSVYWALSADGNHYSMKDSDLNYGPEDLITVIADPPDPNVDLAFCVGNGLSGTGCGVFASVCCYSDGSCADGVPVADCTGTGGVFLPGGATCADDPCPAPCEAEDCTDSVSLNVPGEACASGLPCTRAFSNGICDATVVGTTCAVSPGDPPSPDHVFGSDTWLSYTTQPGECGDLTFSTCTNGDYDGMLAVYDVGTSCGCPADISEPTACGDDTCGQGGGMATVTIPVAENRCYMIRIGGWNGAQGTGELSLTLDTGGCPTDTLQSPLPEDGLGIPCTPGVCVQGAVGTACENDRDCVPPPFPVPEGACASDCANDAACFPDAFGAFPGTCYVPKNRYLSLAPNPLNAGRSTARRVRLDLPLCTCSPDCDGDGDFGFGDVICVVTCLQNPNPGPECANGDVNCDGSIDQTDVDLVMGCADLTPEECQAAIDAACQGGAGQLLWVVGWLGEPDANGLSRVVPEADRHYADWTTFGFPRWCSIDAHCPNGDCDTLSGTCLTGMTSDVQVADCVVSPNRDYLIEAIDAGNDITDEANYSPTLALFTTEVWGDVIGAVTGGIATPPDGAVNFGDILEVVKGFQAIGGAPTAWLDLDPERPDYAVTFDDILAAVQAWTNPSYPGADPCTCLGWPFCP